MASKNEGVTKTIIINTHIWWAVEDNTLSHTSLISCITILLLLVQTTPRFILEKVSL